MEEMLPARPAGASETPSGVLSDKQVCRVEASSPPDVPLAFALAWTRVEATLKADGRGFAFDDAGGRLPEAGETAHV